MTRVERRNEALERFGGEIQVATEGTKMWRLRCINDEPAVTTTRTTRARSRGTTTTTRTTTTTTRTRTRTRRTGAAQTRGRARTRRTSKKTRKTAAAQAAAGAFIRGGTGRKTGATTGAKKSQQEARTSTNINQSQPVDQTTNQESSSTPNDKEQKHWWHQRVHALPSPQIRTTSMWVDTPGHTIG